MGIDQSAESMVYSGRLAATLPAVRCNAEIDGGDSTCLHISASDERA
jgi:hypothetical protein